MPLATIVPQAAMPARPLRVAGSRRVLWIGVVTMLLPLLSLVVAGWVQYRSLRAAEADRLELLATVLEDHATRTVDATANTLSALADHLVGSPERELMTPLLLQSMASLPALRGIAVINMKGVIVGSTVPAEVGEKIDLGRLGPLPEPGRDSLGLLVRGSSLLRLSQDTATLEGARGVSFIPLMRQVQASDGASLLLVGLLNPDSFGSYQQLTIKDEHTAALLTSYSGVVLATLPWVPLEPGTRLLQHPLFSDFSLQQRDHGRFEGEGARPGTHLTAFRVSRTRPLVMLVEQPRAVLLGQWWELMLPLMLGGTLISLGILGLTSQAWRALKTHERAQQAGDTVRDAAAFRERQLDELFKLVPELIFRCDMQGAITFVNARYADFTGRGVEAALGRSLASLVMPVSRDAVEALFDPHRGRGPRRGQAMLEGSYGVQRCFDITVVPLYEGDVLQAFAGSAVDLTERLLLQEKLRGQVQYATQLLELCPVPVSIIDLENHYISVNRAWEQFNDRSGSEVIGRPSGEHWTTAERGVHLEHDRVLMEGGGGSRSYEVVYTRLDQSRRDVRMTKVAILGENGRPTAILNTFIDLTEYRDAERAMAHAREAAEEVSRIKSEFIASVSHELRTPLQAVLGFSEIGLARELKRERQLTLFNEIHLSGRGMLLMVNDLLDLAKVEGAVAQEQRPVIDLRDTIEAVRRELSPLMTPDQLTMRLTLGHRPLNVRIDPLRSQQLLRNLLANAIKVSPRGGLLEVICIQTGGVEGSQVLIQVRDQGPGIPEAELNRIFDPFVQSSFTKGQTGAGTGLGLAICRKIVNSCRGELRALNRPGGGASFELMLPLVDLPAEVYPGLLIEA